MVQDSSPPERPRLEPEIIPPGQARREPDWRQRNGRPDGWTVSGTHRIYVGKPGTLGIVLIMLLVGILVAVVTLAVIGALLIWIPVAAVLLLIAALSGLRRWRRL
jgi:TM2 domain-containing membrane protein YozV